MFDEFSPHSWEVMLLWKLTHWLCLLKNLNLQLDIFWLLEGSHWKQAMNAVSEYRDFG